MAIETDAANNDVLHAGARFPGNCSGVGFEARSYFEFDPEFFGKLHCARLHHLRSGARHLEQFVVSDFVEFFCIGYEARVAREDAIDIGKNLTNIGVQSAGQRNCGQVRAATAKRGCFPFGSLTLKTGDDDNVIVRQ